jgi:signal transduction histidine kinase
LRTDREKLRVIVRNLVENAVKYSPGGTVTMDSKWNEASDLVEISVRDTGRGIPQSDLQAIFEAFRRGSDADKNGTAGVGLGLYVVHRLVDLLGGKVDVESEVGKGSVFTITVPRVYLPSKAPNLSRQTTSR